MAEDTSRGDGPHGRTGEPGPLLRLAKNQKVAFLAVGAFNTGAGTVWFVVLQLVIGNHVDYHVTLVAAYLCNVLTAFAMYRYLVFRVRGNFLLDLGRFVVINLSTFLLNLVVMTVAVSGFDFPPIPSQLVITPVLALGSYFGYRDFSFRRQVTDVPTDFKDMR